MHKASRITDTSTLLKPVTCTVEQVKLQNCRKALRKEGCRNLSWETSVVQSYYPGVTLSLAQGGSAGFTQFRSYSSVSEFPIHVQKAPVGHLSLPGDPKIDSVSLHVSEVLCAWTTYVMTCQHYFNILDCTVRYGTLRNAVCNTAISCHKIYKKISKTVTLY